MALTKLRQSVRSLDVACLLATRATNVAGRTFVLQIANSLGGPMERAMQAVQTLRAATIAATAHTVMYRAAHAMMWTDDTTSTEAKRAEASQFTTRKITEGIYTWTRKRIGFSARKQVWRLVVLLVALMLSVEQQTTRTGRA